MRKCRYRKLNRFVRFTGLEKKSWNFDLMSRSALEPCPDQIKGAAGGAGDQKRWILRLDKEGFFFSPRSRALIGLDHQILSGFIVARVLSPSSSSYIVSSYFVLNEGETWLSYFCVWWLNNYCHFSTSVIMHRFPRKNDCMFTILDKGFSVLCHFFF